MSAHVVDRLSEYLDDELVPAERASIEAHLRDCPDCTTRLEELAAVDDLARALPAEAPDGYFTDFSSRVRARVEAKPAQRAPFRLPAWTLAAAAAIALGVTVPALLRRQSLEPSAVPHAAPVPTQLEPQLQSRAPAAADAPPAREGENRAASTAPAPAAQDRRQRAEKSLAPPPPQSLAPRAPAVHQEEYAEPHGLAGGVAESLEGASSPAETGRDGERDALKADTDEQMRALGYVSMEKKAKTEAPGFAAAAGAAAPAPKRALESARKDQPTAALARTRFGELLDRAAPTAAEARALREAWRVHASLASGGEADEARVRVLEVGAQAYRLGRDGADLALLEKDTAAYLARPDALQAARARAALQSVRGDRP